MTYLSNDTPEEWGYKFISKSFEQLLRDFEGTSNLYGNFQQQRRRAVALISEIAGNESKLFYVCRKEAGRNPGEEIWELIIATDCDDSLLPEILQALGKTLSIRGVVSENGNNGLQILSTRLLELEYGRINNFALPRKIRLKLDVQNRIGISRASWRHITSTIPLPQRPTQEQLQTWEVFLNVEERIAREKQFCVQFISHNYGSATRNITFRIFPESATISASENNQLEENEFWGRVRNARYESIRIAEAATDSQNSRELGSINNSHPEDATIRINLNSIICDLIAQQQYSLPAEGYLIFEPVGDITQIERKKSAIRELQRGQSQNPYLGEFLFDASQARIPQQSINLQQQDLLFKIANPGQRAAVETALASPDLVLIQGPPGTGKTTVIAEICYQVARQGGRTLITSQANLAVDNALSRLEHNPIIRAVRKGNRNSVGEEGRPFLEDQVISNWLRNTAADCQQRLSQKQENVEIYQRLLESRERFLDYLRLETDFSSKYQDLQSCSNAININLQHLENDYNQKLSQQQKLRYLLNNLEQLLTDRATVSFQEPTNINLLRRLHPYITRNIAVGELEAKVNLAIENFNLTPPNTNMFAKAIWMKNYAITNNSKIEQTYIQSIRQKINYLRASLFTITQSKNDLEEWKFEAHENFQTTLYKTLEQRQLFPASLIELPSSFGSISPDAIHLLWRDSSQKYENEFNHLVKKVRQYDEVRNIIYQINNSTRHTEFHNQFTQSVINKYFKITNINNIGSIDALNELHQNILALNELSKPFKCLSKTINKVIPFLFKRYNYTTVFLLLIRPSCRIIVLAALRRKADTIANRCEPNNINTTIRYISIEVVEAIYNSASNLLNQKQIETNNNIQNKQKELEEQRKIITELQYLNPFGVLAQIQSNVREDLNQSSQATQEAQRQLEDSENQLVHVESQLQLLQDNQAVKRNWWQNTWDTIPDSIKPQVPTTGLFDVNFLRNFQEYFSTWQQELSEEQAYLNRYKNLVTDWINRLSEPSQQDNNDLKRIYIDNANVIGITCNQAARGSFSREFPFFDVVIIDEVSKCTPPELLIPALKARKLVLVGDHKQLPPLLDNNTLDEVAEQLSSTTQELSYLRESLFSHRFEEANYSIKKMLNIQYRMHPNIMDAINQFYNGNLKCGLPQPDIQRAHNLETNIINNNHHLMWVTTPIVNGFRETRDGTSYVNHREIDAIINLCQQIESSWLLKVDRGENRKEIGIITFYGSQLRQIESRINPNDFPSLHIRTGTVDRFQGMEKQVIIVSLVRNNRHNEIGFARAPERVNVAFSRAQELLIIVGCHSLFTQHSGNAGRIYSNIYNTVRLNGGLINVSDIIS